VTGRNRQEEHLKQRQADSYRLTRGRGEKTKKETERREERDGGKDSNGGSERERERDALWGKMTNTNSGSTRMQRHASVTFVCFFLIPCPVLLPLGSDLAHPAPTLGSVIVA
jgi:hypothetical protein